MRKNIVKVNIFEFEKAHAKEEVSMHQRVPTGQGGW